MINDTEHEDSKKKHSLVMTMIIMMYLFQSLVCFVSADEELDL